MAAKREPRTEKEAEDLKEYLQDGGSTSLETVRAFSEKKPAVLALGRTTNVPLAVDNAVLSEQVAREALRATIELEFPNDGQDLAVLVFFNNDGATADTPADDPSFVGTVAFFCHGETKDGKFVCIHPQNANLKYRFDATRALKGRSENAGQARANLVAIGPLERAPSRRELRLTSASVEITRSVVKAG